MNNTTTQSVSITLPAFHTMSGSYEAFVGKVVGAVRVREPFTYRKADYECAAWYEIHTATPGVYPLVLRRGDHDKTAYYLTANVAAVCTDDFFPALWGGVAIGRTPYVPQHAGEARVIVQRFDIGDAIDRSTSAPTDIVVLPEFWAAAAEYYQQRIAYHLPHLIRNAAERLALGDSDPYRSRLSGTYHNAEWIAADGKKLERIYAQIGYHGEPGFRRLHDTNMAWALEFVAALPAAK